MPDPSQIDADESFQKLLADCLEAIERGELVDREHLMREHPDHAASICEFLDNHQLVGDAIGELRAPDQKGVSDSAFAQTVDSQSASSSKTFKIGESLRYVGEYEIVDEIARGGMGIVFRARQSKLRRDVALKMILSGRLATEADVDRFYREARAAAALNHPNIVGVHEVAEHEGHHYFTMDLVAGRSLASIISEGTLSPRKSAELIIAVALAIEYAHEHGVLHRDLKPANILIDDDGKPHVTDFGLAKTLAGNAADEDLTASGQILGTPTYMSPEQASAKHDLVGVASDVYSLGAILYACLSGRGPFVADSVVDTIRQVIEKEPLSLRLLNPQVPKDLETICLKCLRKEPHRRYGTAGKLADDLGRFIEGRPVVARPVPAVTKAWRWSRRNPGIALLSALSVLLLLVGSSVSTFFAIQADDRANAEAAQRQRADEAAIAANQARADMASALERESEARLRSEESLANEQVARKQVVEREREARWSEYVARLTVIQRPWQDREFGQLSRMVDELVPKAGEPDFRGWEWSYYHDLSQQVARSIPVSANTVRGSWSPDGNQIVTAGAKLQIWNFDGMKLVSEHDLKDRLYNSVFSPDGKTIACGLRSGAIVIFDPVKEQVVRVWHAHGGGSPYLSFSPDGSQLASGSMDGSAAVWDIESGQRLHQLCQADKDNYLRNVGWHPSKSLIVTSDRQGYVRVFDAKTGKRKFSKRTCAVSCNVGHWSPDGKTLAGGGAFPNFEIRLYTDTGEPKGVLEKPGRSASWSPDSTRLVVGDDDHEIRIVDVQRDAVVSTLRFHGDPVGHLAWSPDGDSILSIDDSGVAKVWKVNGDVPDSLVIHQDSLDIRRVRYSNDGKLIAGCGNDRKIRIWRAMDGKLLETSAELSAAVKDFAWSEDSSKLVSLCKDNNVWVWERDRNSLRKLFKTGSRPVIVHGWLDWRPGTRQIALGAYGEDTNVFDLDTGRNLYKSPIRTAFARWNPSGNSLAVGVKVVDAKLAPLWTIPIPWQENGGVAWSPNGRLLAVVLRDGRVKVTDLRAESLEPAVARGHRHAVSSVAWHPSGTRIATGDFDGTLKLWDAATLDEVWSTKLPHRVLSLDWSPDGRHLVSSDGVDVGTYPTRAKEGNVYSIRIWGSQDFELLTSATEMLPTPFGRVLTRDPRASTIAQRVINSGGRITIYRTAENQMIDSLGGIPSEEFQVNEIDLADSGITDEQLTQLHGLSTLTSINLRSTELSDAAVRKLLHSFPGVNPTKLDTRHREFRITADGDIQTVQTPEEELAELTEAIEKYTSEHAHLFTRAKWYAKHLDWKNAYADIDRYLVASPISGWWNCAAAYAAFAAGNVAAYQTHVHRNLSKLPAYDYANEPGTGAYLVCAVCLNPNPDVELSSLMPLAENLRIQNPGSFYHCKADIILRFRLGEYDQVLTRCEPFRDRGKFHNEQILVHSLRAITLHRLDRTDEAWEALLNAESLARDTWPEPKQNYEADYGDLGSYVEALSLLNEARQSVQPAQALNDAGAGETQ
ncbi:protein kinase domain-containing protein [Novipirellula rosea]|uniref:Protein kinase domain-containing protein n=1 Tax=Novipirellula rosea TaxID=1031540 RepID=A0ABP8MRT3_9BACT